MAKQHKVIAYLKVKVEFLVDENVTAQDVLDDTYAEVYNDKDVEMDYAIEESTIYSDELVRG
jgi:hypothetical protein